MQIEWQNKGEEELKWKESQSQSRVAYQKEKWGFLY